MCHFFWCCESGRGAGFLEERRIFSVLSQSEVFLQALPSPHTQDPNVWSVQPPRLAPKLNEEGRGHARHETMSASGTLRGGRRGLPGRWTIIRPLGLWGEYWATRGPGNAREASPVCSACALLTRWRGGCRSHIRGTLTTWLLHPSSGGHWTMQDSHGCGRVCRPHCSGWFAF